MFLLNKNGKSTAGLQEGIIYSQFGSEHVSEMEYES